MNSIREIFMYDFMVRALIVGVLMALAAGLVGIPLVLKRRAMLGDGLSHLAFAGFAVAMAAGLAPMEFAIPLVILASILLLRLEENGKISGEAGIALVSTTALAVGIMAVSLNGTNIDINSYLFGSVLTTGARDLVVAAVLAIVVVLVYVFLYHRIFAMTFDEKFARSIGMRTNIYNILFASLCSVVVVLGMKTVGTLLVSSLVIFPVLTARQLTKSFRMTVVGSGVIAVVNFLAGFLVSYMFALPTGATIVIVSLLGLVIFKLISLLK